MNKVIVSGRPTKDPEIRQAGETKVARYTLAVDGRKDSTYFISVVCFGKQAEFAEKYVRKGVKYLITGHIQTGSYEKDGRKVYTTDVVAEEHEFCEPKRDAEKPAEKPDDDGFIPVDGNQEELPFN